MLYSLPNPFLTTIMKLNLSLLLFLAYTTVPSDASIFARGSDSVVRTVGHLHRRAAKHSAGLARDLRLTFGSVMVKQQPVGTSKVYCVSSSSLGNGTSLTGPGSPNTTSPAVPPPSSSQSTNSTSSSRPSSSIGATTRGSPTPSPSASPSPPGNSSPPPSSPWKLAQSYSGNSFFDGWDFFTGGDPTHGQVTFVDQPTGQAAGLIDINSAGNAVMKVETTPQVQSTRQSIRITTHNSYTGGLVIMDSVHMPTGCGTWPAFWSNGPNWPAGGEIDIVEGVHDYTNNQATIHTNPGCSLASSSSQTLGITGTVVGGTDCSAANTGNQGCGVRAAQTNSFGEAFNNIGGGVYGMKWDDSGIAVYFFPRSAIPSDITSGAPQPSKWGQPMAFWPAAQCNPFQFFNSHSLIFDTTLCGDWASSAWGVSGIPGQDQSCAQRTGVSTCEEFIRNNGASFNDAYWEVKSVKVYQTS